MNTKIKVLAGALAAGAMFASASASATVVWDARGTISAWSALPGGALTDTGCPAGFTCFIGPGDGDTTFTLIGTNLAGDNQVHFVEAEEVFDFYNVDVEHDGLPFIAVLPGTGNGSITYRIDTLDPHGFDLSALGSQRFGPAGSSVTKEIRDANTNALLLTLTSVDEARVPLEGYASFPRSQHLLVTDTLNGEIESLTNEYTVPEPASLALFGIGLLGLLSRRRSS